MKEKQPSPLVVLWGSAMALGVIGIIITIVFFPIGIFILLIAGILAVIALVLTIVTIVNHFKSQK